MNVHRLLWEDDLGMFFFSDRRANSWLSLCSTIPGVDISAITAATGRISSIDASVPAKLWTEDIIYKLKEGITFDNENLHIEGQC